MKFTRLNISLVVGLFVCFAAAANMAYAQKFSADGGGRLGMRGMSEGILGLHGLMPFVRLNLSLDQQKNLIDILDKYHEMRIPYMDAMMSLNQEMADILEAGTLDEEIARAVFKKQEAVREEMMILEIKLNNEIKGVLSFEQLELLKHPVAGRPGGPFPPLGE